MPPKRTQPIEYRLLITPTYDERVKRHGTLFLIETTKQFSAFSYQIVVQESVQGKTFLWSLHGLRAPELSMPASGAAQFRKIHYGLKGKYSFTLRKSDGTENSFEFTVLASSVRIRSDIPKPFVSLCTAEVHYEQNRARELEIPKPKADKKRPTYPKPALLTKTKGT